MIEAHFYFFVVIVVLTLYEDWVPFLVAVAYVVLHHGIVGALDPSAVYNHADAGQHPWRWAFIHGAFVAAAGVGAIIAWRLNEETRLAALGDLEERKHAVSLLKATLQSTADGILVVDSTAVASRRSSTARSRSPAATASPAPPWCSTSTTSSTSTTRWGTRRAIR